MVKRTFFIVGIGLVILILTALIVYNKPQSSGKPLVGVESEQ